MCCPCAALMFILLWSFKCDRTYLSFPPTMADIVTLVLTGIAFILDVVFYPLYFIYYMPYNELSKRCSRRTTIEVISDTEVHAKPVVTELHRQIKQNQPDVDNTYELFKVASQKYINKPCSGVRKVLSETMETDQKNGKSIKKWVMEDEYQWKSYKTIQHRIDNLASGLMTGTPVRPKDIVVIYADSCLEWFIAALACFKNNYTIATLYTNLGSEGVAYGIGHVKPKLIITSQEMLPKLLDILARPNIDQAVKNIMYFDSSFQKLDMEEIENVHPDVEITSFGIIESIGRAYRGSGKVDSTPSNIWARKHDIAIIMFTSGSTGTPKGVQITHESMMAAIQNQEIYLLEFFGEMRTPDECYLAYLPMAHILELTLQLLFCCAGIKLAYSSPHTLTDKSLKIPLGKKGDLSLIRPTYLAAVPLVLDRVYKAIMVNVTAKGPLFAELFQFAYQYKKYWYKKGLDTPILNALLFKKVQGALGGRIKLLFSGGATLAKDVNEFFKICICKQVAIAYGMTECAGGASCSDMFNEAGECGRPIFGTTIKLESWEEGNYRVTDQCGPRGEIVLNSNSLANGYYKCEDEASNAAFFTDSNGVRWIRTGDIGHLNPLTGSLSIVDRRKDLVKLQMGEYVSLSKVESEIKIHPLVDMVCVYADSCKNATIALIVPDTLKLLELKDRLNLISPNGLNTKAELCRNQILVDYVLKDITHYVSRRLQNFEIPKGIRLVHDEWTPDSGLVTPAMKLKRIPIQKAFQQDIDKIYEAIEMSKSKMLTNGYKHK